MGRTARILLAVTLLLAPTLGAAPAPERVDAAVAFLAAQQREDGGFAKVATPYVVEAVAQAGLDPKAWPTPQRSAFAALRPYPVNGSADAVYKSHLRLAHAASTAGYDARDVNGLDVLARVRAGFDGTQSGSPATINDDVWAILALRAAGVPEDDPQVRASALQVRSARAPGGGWAYTIAASRSDTDMTGMALAALAAAGHDVRDDLLARAWLDATYDATTGGHDEDGDPARGRAANCQSTLWALHGYHLLGAPPRPETLAYLDRLRRADGGWADSEDAAASDPWCTAEALVHAAGGRYPLAGRLVRSVRVGSPAHALEPVVLEADAPPGATVSWRLGDTVLEGPRVRHEFATSGRHPYRVSVHAPDGRYRADLHVDVLSARPRAMLAEAPAQTLRGVPFALDLRPSHDPDGRVVALDVDWGDGNRTTGPLARVEHRYEAPGPRVVRARVQDDAGSWSDPIVVPVDVVNRAPVLADVPGRLVADRVAPVLLPLRVTDPDGDGTRLAWRVGATTGEGNPSFRLDALGDHRLELEARDPWGAATRANVTVTVVNLPPRLGNLTLPESVVADELVEASVAAEDDDGSPPSVIWRVANRTWTGPSVLLQVPEGAHTVEVEAVDADGARQAIARSLVARAPEAPPVALRLRNVSLEYDGRHLLVDYVVEPAHAHVALRWWTEEAQGLVELAPGDAVDVGPAASVNAEIVARAGDLTVRQSAGLLRAPPPPPAPWGPVAVRVEPLPALAGAPARVTATAPAADASYAFDFGDGNVSRPGAAAWAVHAWSRPGVYEVRALVRAPDGREATATAEVHVQAPAPPAAPEPAPPEDAPVAPASLAPRETARDVTQEASAARVETPAPAWLAAAALAAAARGRRGRSA